MLIVNQHDGIEEGPCFITRNPREVKALETHFNNLWSRYKNKYAEVKTTTELDEVINKNSGIQPAVDEIAKYLRNKASGIITKYIDTSLKELEKYLKDIQTQEIEINHAQSTSSLLSAFSMYMAMTKPKDQYFVITTIGVWKKVMHEDQREKEFINANTSALKRGVKMFRILILDYYLMTSIPKVGPIDEKSIENYNKHFLIKAIIKQHIVWLQKFPVAYDFKILFSKKYDDKIQYEKNFTLIKYSKENVLFVPFKDIGENVLKTAIKFKPRSISNEEKQFEDLIDEVNSQNISQDHLNFLKDISHDFFSIEENIKKVVGLNYWNK